MTPEALGSMDPHGDVRALESDLGLRPGFFEEIRDEDDWSFIIKLHALLEAAVAHLLTEELGQPQLQRIFARIELSNVTTGKLAFASALEILDKEERSFVRALSEIRNRFAHDVRNAGNSLKDYVDGLDKNQRKQLLRTLGPEEETMELDGTTVHSADFVYQNLKIWIWMKALFILGLMYHKKLLAHSKNRLAQTVLDSARSKRAGGPQDEVES